jgi:arylsulfatase A-like enzyme
MFKISRLAPSVFVLLFSSFVQAQEKPNNIFILTDDQRWDALGFAGNEISHTPEMHKLAKEGVYFRSAFVTTPISAARGASTLTGMYERTHGYTFGRGQIKKSYLDHSYPKLMGDSGYYSGFLESLGSVMTVLLPCLM